MVKTKRGATPWLVMKAHLLLPLFLLVGCAAPEAHDDDVTESASEVVAAPRPATQHFGNLPQATLDATLARFDAKNPDFRLGSGQVNELTGGIRVVNRDAPLGPPVTQTAAEVIAKATAFLEKNAEELAVRREDIARADVEAKPYPFESGTYPWTVYFKRVTETPGYEGFDTADRHLYVSVDFWKDGTIGHVYSGVSFFPDLRISTTPALAADDTAVIENIVGTEAVWHDETFVPGPDLHLGNFTADDVQSKRLVMHLAYDATGFTMTLAYEVEVMRGQHSWKFTVHSGTGAILAKEQSYSF